MTITTAIITSCSSTRTVQPKAKVADLPAGLTMQQALEKWLALLNAHTADLTPGELYRGMGFYTLAKIREQFKPLDTFIVTGGQGLITLDEPIVPYDFTASPKEMHNIHQKVTAEPFVQTVWWRMINQARNKGVSPISSYVSSAKADLVIIACSKIFLRYIADDILSTPFRDREKIRILLSASSIGGVPVQLRPMMVPFDRDFIQGLPGNRNDNNHRAALRFLELLQDPQNQRLTVSGHQAVLGSMSRGEPPTGGSSANAQVFYDGPKNNGNLEEWLRARPDILALDPEVAYKRARRELGTLGGRLYFKGIHRKLTATAVNASEEEVVAATSALQGMSFLTSTGGASGEDDEVLRAVAAFVTAVKAVAPKAVFTPQDIVTWAPQYYKTIAKEAPAFILSPNKLSYVLKNNASVLGLKEAEGQGGKGYMISTTT